MSKRVYKRETLITVPRINLDGADEPLSVYNIDNGFYYHHQTKKLESNLPDIASTSDIEYVERNLAEENDNYQQIIVGGLFRNSSKTKCILLRRQKGEFRGLLTLVEGHASVVPSMKEIPLKNQLIMSMIREFGEEVHVSTNTKKSFEIENFELLSLVGDFRENYPTNTESSYHIGYLFDIQIPDDVFDAMVFSAGEPEKNAIEVLNLNEVDTSHCDSWCGAFIDMVRN